MKRLSGYIGVKVGSGGVIHRQIYVCMYIYILLYQVREYPFKCYRISIDIIYNIYSWHQIGVWQVWARQERGVHIVTRNYVLVSMGQGTPSSSNK